MSSSTDRTLGLALFAGYVVGAIVTAVAIRGMVRVVPCDCHEHEDEELPADSLAGELEDRGPDA